MNQTWSNSRWSLDNSFNFRHVISLFFALIALWIILLIPIKKPITFDEDDVINIELIKPPVKDLIEQPLFNKIIENQPIIKNTKPVPMIQPKPQNKEVITESIKKTSIEPMVTIKKTVIDTQILELPNAGTILNSMESIQKYFETDDQFNAAKNDPNAFHFRQLIKPKTKKLITNVSHLAGANVTEYTPIQMKAVKGFIGFFAPMNDIEKTQDTMTYCSSLGRKSIFCPNHNPLKN